MDKDKKKGFAPPPIMTPLEREKKIKKLLNEDDADTIDERDMKTVSELIRVPKWYIDDVREIARLTGQTKNAIWIDILPDAIRQKMKAVKDKK